ncbi:MAG: hypothetical protein J0M20_03765 [Burkholderiales bacterium]|nr:hypothetical protein [Burkholderiales bacterium]
MLLTTTAAATWWQAHASRHLAQQLRRAQSEQAAAAQRAALQVVPPAHHPAPWWATLPTTVADQRSAAEQFSADAITLGPAWGVQVLQLSFASPTQADAAPYRKTTVQTQLRGTYVDIKRWLAEMLARRPRTLALESLDLRRVVEANMASNEVPAGLIDVAVEWSLFERAAER